MSKPSLYMGLKDDGSDLRFEGETHVITVGPPGCGKSTAVLVPNLLSCPHSCVVIDPKGELCAITYEHRDKLGDVHVINPMGVLADKLPHMKSKGFNPLRGLRHGVPSFPNECARIAEALVPPSTSGRNEHFTFSAIQLITAGIMWAVMKNPGKATMQEVNNYLTGQLIEQFIDMIVEMMDSGNVVLRNKVSRFTNKHEEVASVLATVSRSLESLDDPLISDDLAKGDFDFSTLRDKTVTAYIILPPTEFERHQTWMRLVINSAIYSLLTVPENNRPPVVFFMDEFYAAVGRLPIVKRVMGLTRGYGLQLWPFFQSLLQTKELFGDGWEIFVACAGILQSFAPADMFTAEYLSRRSGKTTAQTQSFGKGGFSYGQAGVPTLLPQAVMGMPRGDTLIYASALPYPTSSATKHYSLTRYAKRASDNPYDVRYS